MKQEQEFHVIADRGYALGPEFVATYTDLEAAQQECARLNKGSHITYGVFVMEDVTDKVYSSTPIATEEELLKHRLSMVLDDIKVIRKHIYKQDIAEFFEKPTGMAEECWTHFNNIEIACDLNSDECYGWNLFF